MESPYAEVKWFRHTNYAATEMADFCGISTVNNG